MNGKSASVHIVGLVAEKIKHLRIHDGTDKIEGVIRIADDHEQGRFPVSEGVQLQFVVAHQLPQLCNVKGSKSGTAANQDRFGRFTSRQLVFAVLLHSKVIRVPRLQLVKHNVHRVFEVFIILSGFRSIDHFEQGSEVFLVFRCLVPDVPDEGCIVELFSLHPKIFAGLIAVSLRVDDNCIDQLEDVLFAADIREWVIDVNLKGIKLDTEDIFKGYLFSQDSSKEIRDYWVELKESWMKFNERCNCKPEKSVYSLTKILEHYIYCHVLSKPEYKDVSINEKFTLDSPCEVNGTKYYLGDHVIKVIRNNTYMKEVLVGSKEYIDCLTEIIAADGGAPGCIRDLLKNIENNEVKIICNFIKKTILDKTLVVPKILILKYYLSICDGKAKKATCKNLYAIYFYNVLFMLFGDKKSDAENIKRISRSTEYYPEVVKAIKNFFEDGNISESRQIAIAKWNSNYENEALQYKCKSLATIYNYFTINNNSVEISSSDDVYNFLSDEDVYSIEHFIVNGSGSTTYVDGKDNYELPDSVKKYSAYIFNFIFVPKSINNDIFKNYSVRTKMELLSKSNRTSEIKCEYSKMIIDIVKDMFADEVTITDLNDSEQKELDKYWLVTFKNEYSRFTSRVIDKLLDHFSNTHTDK